jgi:hypothetical protein
MGFLGTAIGIGAGGKAIPTDVAGLLSALAMPTGVIVAGGSMPVVIASALAMPTGVVVCGSFVPSQVAGYLFDYDASILTPGAITTWTDGSGNGHTLSGNATANASGGTGPNGTAYVSANGVANQLAGTFTNGQPWEIFAVFKFDTATPSGTTLFDGHTANAGRAYAATNTSIQFTASADTNALRSSGLTLTNWHTLNCSFNGTSGLASVGGVNATQVSGTGLGTNAAAGLVLFNFGGGGGNAKASLARVIGYSAALSSGDRASVLAYLRLAYGVT